MVECHRKISYCYVFPSVYPLNQNSPNGSTWMYSNKVTRRVYNLFGIALWTSASLGWTWRMVMMLVWLPEAGKKIRGLWKWRWGYCSAVMDGSVVGAAPVRCRATRLKQDKTDNVNLKWDPNIIYNRWCKIHHQKVLDVKRISRATAAPTDVVSTVHSELN